MKQTSKWKAYLELMRFNRPIGICLLLWPILWALWIAGEGFPPVQLIAIFVLGVVVMRAAGCVINDIWDRDLDKKVPRTQQRPLAAGTLSVQEAIGAAAMLLIAAGTLALYLNTYTLLLALAGLAGTIIYPLMKRITYYPQFVLGIVFNWGILMVFTAMTDTLPEIAWLLLATAVLWTLAYDTLYAMADREADIKVGMKSTAILLGDMDRVGIGAMQLLFLIGWVLIGRQLDLNIYFYLGLLVVLGLFAYEWWLIRDRDPEASFAAFNHNNWVGAIIFIALLAGR